MLFAQQRTELYNSSTQEFFGFIPQECAIRTDRSFIGTQVNKFKKNFGENVHDRVRL